MGAATSWLSPQADAGSSPASSTREPCKRRDSLFQGRRGRGYGRATSRDTELSEPERTWLNRGVGDRSVNQDAGLSLADGAHPDTNPLVNQRLSHLVDDCIDGG